MKNGVGSPLQRPNALALVGAVIVHYHREPEAARLAADLIEVQGLLTENVVLVDNGSAPGLLGAELTRTGVRPKTLSFPNVGFAAAVNAGCESLPEPVEFVVILSHEVILEPGCVLELITQLQRTPDALVGPVLTLDEFTVWSAGGDLTPLRCLPRHRLQGMPVSAVPDTPRRCAWLDGAVVATSRGLLRRVGGLDERYFLYMEDVDLGMQVRSVSAEVVVVPAARARQAPGPGIDPYIWTRNMFLLFRKHHRWIPWLLWLCSCAVGLLRDLAIPGRRKNLSRRTRAVFDGIRARSGPPPSA